VAQAHPQLTTRPAHVVLGISHLVLAVLVGHINRVSGVFKDLYNSVIPQYHCGLYVRYLFLSPLFCILEKKSSAFDPKKHWADFFQPTDSLLHDDPRGPFIILFRGLPENGVHKKNGNVLIIFAPLLPAQRLRLEF
jgi:hypothetical protein